MYPGSTTRRESLSFGFAANHRFSPRGCKGRSPLHKKAKNLPLPRRGRGSSKVYFAGGFAPGTPALNRLRHLQTPPCRSPAVVCPAGRRVDEHWRCPAGGLPGRSPGRPALSFIGCPHPPSPPSRREGGAFSFLMQGASPLASPGAEPMVCCKPDRKQFPASGAARIQPPGTTAAKSISAANGLMPGCRGLRPRRNKVIFSPFPAGEGGRGDRGQNQN